MHMQGSVAHEHLCAMHMCAHVCGWQRLPSDTFLYCSALVVLRWEVLTESGRGVPVHPDWPEIVLSLHTIVPGVLTGVLGTEFQILLFTSKYFND